MGLRHVYIGHLSPTMVVVFQVVFHYEMGPPMLEKQVKEPHSRVAAPLFAQTGVGRDNGHLRVL